MITFKEIEMVGFKSFADDTHISFDGGITAIVGPNGCGKSNVSDAIRWVLGEQSSKALRGKNMQDVIFAGTEKRKKLSYSEVSLIFDNTNKWFNIEYDEVVITRKLYRNGESDYEINKKPCRLKDIRDLLYDSGIGKDGYSIIGQGRVDEIILSKPEERRAIFEEAAGISKYKARKTETENRLVRVRDNLSRAGDIVAEVERRLGPLKRQSEDAKKFLELRENLKKLEINAYVFQYDNASNTKFEINEKLQGYKDNLNVLNAHMEAEQAKYDKSLNEINSIDKRAGELHEKVLAKTVALEKKQGDSRLLDEQTKHLKLEIDRLNNEINSYKSEIDERTKLVNSASALKEEEQKNLNRFMNESQEVADKYLYLLDELTGIEGEKEESQRTIIDNLSKLTDIKANLSAYIAKRDTLIENIEQDEQKLDAQQAQLKSTESELKTCEIEVDNLNKARENKQKNLTSLTENIRDLETKVEDLNSKAYALKSSISLDTNRRTILSNLQADFEGYQFAVKRLLLDGKTNSKLNAAIKGVVGNIITVEEKFQTAIELALGGSIQNIVTKDEDDAKILINYLKESKLGRATFLPISAVKPRNLSASDRAYLNSTGCFGVASDLVKTDPIYRPVIQSLLGATVVCDNLNNAVELSKKSGYAFRIVTLEGDIISPQGSMSGGSKKSNDSSLLGKENEIKALTKNIEEKSASLKSLTDELNQATARLNVLREKLNQENSEFLTISNDYTAKTARRDSLQNSLNELNEEIFSLKSQIKVAENVVSELKSKIDSIDEVTESYNSTQAKVGEYNESNKNAYNELKQKRDEYQELMTTTKVKIAATEEKIRSLTKDINSYNQEIDGIKSNITRVQAELDSQTRVYEEVTRMAQIEDENSETREIKAELDDLNYKLSQFEDFKSNLMQELKSLDDKKTNLSAEISRLNNKIYQEETKLQKVDMDLVNMQERIYQEYELAYSDCKKVAEIGDEFDIKETLIQINRVKNQITALGFVNVNAIEEYKQEGARYEEMNAQIEDLKNAEADAVKIIQDLSKEMLDKFNAEFVKIQENFTKVFKELFGGGNARLELLPSEDPLTAGVEIIAQPPGKVLQQISLLSGGEKTMTAIAILFAILKLKPMPFCFLDEIEAALDDANIERYARYLKRFSDETQFIIITHRKPTMELADALYGVTMEEKGVSKIVSVKLSDAVKLDDHKEEEPA